MSDRLAIGDFVQGELVTSTKEPKDMKKGDRDGNSDKNKDKVKDKESTTNRQG